MSYSIINSFRGAFRWLSNFEPVNILMPDGIEYPSTEHAFQAYKTMERDKRRAIAMLGSPRAAKREGRRLTLRPDWEEVKFDVMLQVNRIKFGNPYLREKLLYTEDLELVEGNDWGDTIWGVCDGVGENHLGKILMKIRDEIRSEP